MADDPDNGFDLDRSIASRLDGHSETDADTYLQAIAVLIGADLTDAQRADAFASVLAEMLARLSKDDRERFCRIADDAGEVTAMSYLSAITRPVSEADRK